jgi:hypothetical protein
MRSMFKTFLLATVSAMFAQAAAAQSALQFNGTASSACALTNPSDGSIEVQPDLRSWATSVPAKITVSNTAPNYAVTVTHDTNWTTAPASTPVTTFAHVASITAGPNTSAQFTGAGASSSASLAVVGDNDLSITLTASAPTPFIAGAHQAKVTVTCALP